MPELEIFKKRIVKNLRRIQQESLNSESAKVKQWTEDFIKGSFEAMGIADRKAGL